MGVRLPIEKAWDGFCTHFKELQKQGRTIAESDDGRYRITLDAEDTFCHLMVFQGDEIVYDETLMTKTQFEDELVYLYDFYIENVDDDEDEEFYHNEFDDDEDGFYISDGQYEPTLDTLLDNVIMEMSPGTTPEDPFYEDMKGDLKIRIEETLLDWQFAVRV